MPTVCLHSDTCLQIYPDPGLSIDAQTFKDEFEKARDINVGLLGGAEESAPVATEPEAASESKEESATAENKEEAPITAEPKAEEAE